MDLVQVATQASRNDAGHVIWFGWIRVDLGWTSRRERIAFGSQGVMYTPQTAQEPRHAMVETKTYEEAKQRSEFARVSRRGTRADVARVGGPSGRW